MAARIRGLIAVLLIALLLTCTPSATQPPTNTPRPTESSPADGYLYLIVDNDWHERWTPDAPPAEMPPVSFYAVWLWKQARGVEPVADVPDAAAIERFKRDTAPLFADNRVLIASYGKILFTAGLGVDVVAPITTTIAPGDMHPDAAGHERIADRLESQVRELVNRVCE